MVKQFKSVFDLNLPIAVLFNIGRFDRAFRRDFQERQPGDYATVQEVFFDNLGNIGRAHLRIPYTVGIDEHGRSNGAETHRSAIGQHDTSLRVLAFLRLTHQQPAGRQLALECRPNFSAVVGRAGLTRAHKHVMPDWRRGDRGEGAEFVRVGNELWFSHNGLMLARSGAAD